MYTTENANIFKSYMAAVYNVSGKSASLKRLPPNLNSIGRFIYEFRILFFHMASVEHMCVNRFSSNNTLFYFT